MQPATTRASGSWASGSEPGGRAWTPHQRLAGTNGTRVNRASGNRHRGPARHAWTRRRGKGRTRGTLLCEFRREIRPGWNYGPGARLSGEIRFCGRAERTSASNRRCASSGGGARSRTNRRRRAWSRSSSYGSAWDGGRARRSRSRRHRGLRHFRQARWKGLARAGKNLSGLGRRRRRPGWDDRTLLAGRHKGRRERWPPRQRWTYGRN